MPDATQFAPEIMNRFTGSEHWYRHWVNRNILFTDGASHVAEAGGEPRWIQAIYHGFGSAVDHHGAEISIVLAVLFALTSLAPLCPRWAMPIATGTATDPNTGPLLILLAAAFLPIRRDISGGRGIRTHDASHPA